MSTPSLNPKITESVTFTNAATLGNAASGAVDIARMYVAQVTALAVGDAVDYLRNIEFLAGALSAVGAAKIASETEAEQGAQMIKQAAIMISDANKNFGEIGSTAAAVLKEYPSS